MQDLLALDAPVDALMRQVARDVVMPSFGALAAADIVEKTPGDLVTVADRLSEERLTEGLLAILPEARVIGEEAVAADASILDGIGEGLAWIVDPIDGTNNFASGVPIFAIMIALCDGGETLAGWILDPNTGRMAKATRGGGAFVNGERVSSRGSGGAIPIGALAVRFFPEEIREQARARMAGRIEDVPIPNCAGEQYPRLIAGRNDVALFWRAQPWDHAPGALILTEAGGRVARFDGTPYRIDQTSTGLLAAATPALWEQCATVLRG